MEGDLSHVSPAGRKGLSVSAEEDKSGAELTLADDVAWHEFCIIGMETKGPSMTIKMTKPHPWGMNHNITGLVCYIMLYYVIF